MPDRDMLADKLLTATLTHYYSYFERRLETAVNPNDEKVRSAIATAALDLVIRTCDPALTADIESRRSELTTAMIAERSAIHQVLFDLAPRLHRPRFVGPINTVFNELRRINLIVMAEATTAAGQYAQLARTQFFTEARFLDGAAMQWADLGGRNAIVYGTPASRLVAELLAEAHWTVADTHIALGDRTFEGERLALIACRARPADPTLGDVVYTSADERVLVGINVLHHGPSDFVIGRCSEAGRYQIVTRGNFARGADGELLTTLAA